MARAEPPGGTPRDAEPDPWSAGTIPTSATSRPSSPVPTRRSTPSARYRPFLGPGLSDQNPARGEVYQQAARREREISRQSARRTTPPKFATAIAGNDLPDTIHLLNGIKGAPNVPQFLTAKCADLTPYLAGDAAKAYPNLASFSTDSLAQYRHGGRPHFAVPLPRNLTGLAGLFKNANVYDKEIGADYVPKRR